MKIKANDTVIVIAGNDKGVSGKVLEVFPKQQKVIVEGVNVHVKHRKPRAGQEGGIINIQLPIHVSNVAIVDPKTKKQSRVRYEIKKGSKVRTSTKSGKELQ